MEVREAAAGSQTLEHLAHALVDAFNDRDRAAWLAVFDPEVEFRPTVLVAEQPVYRGLAGVTRFFDELLGEDQGHRVKIRELRTLGPDHVIIFNDVIVGDVAVAPSAVLIRARNGAIVEVTAYLTDSYTLSRLGFVSGTGGS